jgi:hypothetical protein
MEDFHSMVSLRSHLIFRFLFPNEADSRATASQIDFLHHIRSEKCGSRQRSTSPGSKQFLIPFRDSMARDMRTVMIAAVSTHQCSLVEPVLRFYFEESVPDVITRFCKSSGG